MKLFTEAQVREAQRQGWDAAGSWSKGQTPPKQSITEIRASLPLPEPAQGGEVCPKCGKTAWPSMFEGWYCQECEIKWKHFESARLAKLEEVLKDVEEIIRRDINTGVLWHKHPTAERIIEKLAALKENQ